MAGEARVEGLFGWGLGKEQESKFYSMLFLMCEQDKITLGFEALETSERTWTRAALGFF